MSAAYTKLPNGTHGDFQQGAHAPPRQVERPTQPQGYITPVGYPPYSWNGPPPLYWSNIQDPACNMYWAYFFLGLLLCPVFLICGSCGMRSSLHNEQIAGKASLIALAVWTGAILIAILVCASGEVEENSNAALAPYDD